MACSKLANAIEKDYLTCSLCLEHFSKKKNPKALSCFHTFCQPCLGNFVETTHRGANKVPCPICNTQTKIPAGGTKHLLTNFLIFSLKDTVASKDSPPTHYCDNCEEDSQVKAIVKCLQCQQHLCDECHSAHKRLKNNKSHRVLTLEQIQSGDFDKEMRDACQIMCSVHPSHPIEFYCKDDQGPTCIKCNMVEHRNHDVIHLSDAANEKKEKLQTLMTELKKKIESVNSLSQESMTNNTALNNQMKTLQDTVKNHYTMISEQLIQQQAAVTNQLDQVQKSLSKISQVGKENIDSSADTLNSLYQVIQHLLEGSDAEIISLAEQGQTRIQRLLKMDLPEVPLIPIIKVTKPSIQDVQVVKLKQLWQVTLELDSDKHFLTQIAFQPQPSNILVMQFNADNKDKNSIFCLDPSGNIQKMYPTPNIFSFDTKSDGDIITCYNDKGTSVMSLHDGSKKPFTSYDPCYVSCVICTSCHVVTSYSTLDRSDRTVNIYRQDGAKVSDFTYDTVEKQRYVPYMLADDNTHSVYISDSNDQCVYAFTYEGKLRWRYGTKGTGDGQVNRPRGMCFDSHGNILLADGTNSRVHVISPDGHFKYFLFTKEDGLSLPKDVCLNDKGNLVLVESNGKVRCYEVEY